MIDELKLNEEQAEAIIAKAIEFEVTDDMPDSKKDKLEAAHEVVAFAIDSWVDEGLRPDAEGDAGVAGKMVVEILEMAGVEIDDDDNIEYNDPPEVEGAASDDDADKSAGDEAPFDIDDIIDGYEELTAATRIKKITALELDPDDDDDYNTLVGIEEWENAQEKPSSRVLNFISELLPEEVDGEAEKGTDDGGEADDDQPYTEDELNEMDKDALKEVASEFEGVTFPSRMTDKGKAKVIAAILEAQEEALGENDGDDAGEGESEDESDEPWEGYNDASIKEIKEALDEAKDDDEEPLTAEQVKFVLDYENENDKRKSLVKWLEELYEEIDNDGDGDDAEPEPEPEEEKPKRGRRGRGTKTTDPDDSDDADDAKAKDDRKDAKKGVGGTLILTRDQILEALTNGEVEIELG